MMNFARSFLFLVLLLPSLAFGALEMTYNGRLLQPDGDPEPATPIYLRFDIKTVSAVAGGECFLFKQAQSSTAVTTDLDGVFQLLISGSSADKLYGPADLDTVFSANAIRPCLTEAGVATANSIAAGDSQILELKVYFRFDSSDGWDLIDQQTIRPTIEAVNAQKLAGKPSSNYIQVDSSATQSAFSTFFNATDFSKLQGFASGGALDLGSQQITNVSTPTSDDMAVNKGYADDKIAGLNATTLGTLGVSDANKLMVWSGSQWVVKSVTDSSALSLSGGTMSGGISMGSFGITNLALPASSGSAVNRFYADNRIAGQATSGLGALAVGDNGKILVFNGSNWVAKSITDSNALSLSGGTMAGAINMGGFLVGNVGTPAATGDLVNKQYADNNVGGKPTLGLGTIGTGDIGKLMLFNGTAWVAKSLTDSNTLPSTGGTMSGNLNMNGSGITGLTGPSAATDATNKAYVDTLYNGVLKLTGGSLSGALELGQNDITGTGHIMMANNRIIKLGSFTAEPSYGNEYAGALWYDTTADILKFRSGTVNKPISSLISMTATAPLTYSVSNFMGSLGISPASTTAAGVVTLATSGESNGSKAVAANDARLTNARVTTGTAGGDLTGNYPNPVVSQIQGYAFSSGTPSPEQVPVFSASGWVPSYFGVQNLKDPITGVTQIPLACTAAQTLVWNSGTKVFACTDVAIANTKVSGLGDASTKNVGPAAGNVVMLNGSAQIPTSLLEKEVVRAGGNTLGAELIIGTTDAYNTAFFTANTRRMTILADGKVGIGMTPTEALEVSGNIKASGTVQGSTLVTTSDRRLKENIRDLNGLELILKMQGHRFRWKTDGKEDIGFIAQEIEAVDADLVVTNEETGLKGVKYSNIAAPLVEATKEIYGLCQMAKSQSDRLQREWAEKFSRLEKAQAADRAAIKDMSQHMQKLELDNQRLRQDLEDMKQTLKRLAR